jgi:hypothetical protein
MGRTREAEYYNPSPDAVIGNFGTSGEVSLKLSYYIMIVVKRSGNDKTPAGRIVKIVFDCSQSSFQSGR